MDSSTYYQYWSDWKVHVWPDLQEPHMFVHSQIPFYYISFIYVYLMEWFQPKKSRALEVTALQSGK